ncbi:hypothetical protein ACWGH8_15975 [Nonomuraea muscovyensis]|uniref:Uncharacterized protein n=1 Tax=Nonomuraea muscovyensis TaxID=1124761 RepID=A0A7X0F2Y0_9ACTN|nr:hypothetical protein [Nonomuraea muscovyensis]MBB6352039.1 hypothetical protein [Nonomuraea muscovyensis]
MSDTERRRRVLMLAGVLTGTALLTTAVVLGGGDLAGIRLSPADLPGRGPVRPVTVAATGGSDRLPSSGRVHTVPPVHSADPPTLTAAPSRTRPRPTPERTRRTLATTSPEPVAPGTPVRTTRPASPPPQATAVAPGSTSKGGPPSGHIPPGRTKQPDPRDGGPGTVKPQEAQARQG